MTPSIAPQNAWEPLPAAEWNAATAGHLLRRAGWTARPADVARAVDEGLFPTLERLFPTEPPRLEKPRLVTRFEETNLARQRELARASVEERLRLQRELQDRSRIGVQELSIKWLDYAARPEAAAFAKWVLFLSDVYVISAEKVRNPAAVYQHLDILARHGLGAGPELAKAVSRSPAMIFYLDLGQSQLKSPNENFARELFELFVLGEGNYSEADIKEAARAFTGYRARPDGEFRFEPRLHDSGPKTIFGETGSFNGDQVIDLAFRQPAAATFLPREMTRYYLHDSGLPAEYLQGLGDVWRTSGYNLRTLVRHFFSSRIFFAPEFRANLIKSPIQFYLGLVQEMNLNVAPLARLTLNPLRQMGQLPFHPPNVRGWVGGRQWINSATIAARRQLVELLFAPLDEAALNADELFELVAARSNGMDRFTVPDAPLERVAALEAAAAADALIQEYLAAPTTELREPLRQFIAASEAGPQRPRRVRRAAVTLLQSPAYQLC